MSKATPQEVSQWLREETPEHMKLMTRLRVHLVDSMNSDINENGTPTRDWCRALQRYQGSFVALMTEERERIKLRLALDKSGHTVLSDEELEAELRDLATESLQVMTPETLHGELARRAQLAESLVDDEEE